MSDSKIKCEYSDYTVGFLDVLGFSDYVTGSEQDQSLRANIRDLLEEFNQIVTSRTGLFGHNSKLPPIRLRFFSDSIMISCSATSEEQFRWVLWQVCEFFVKSISRGFFLRGALTVGQHWESKYAFFGPAFLKAYDIERSLAIWPRCVIDPAALARTDICKRESWKRSYSYILEGNDGLPYLDYLGYSFSAALPHMLRENKRTGSKGGPEDLARIFPSVLSMHKKAICEEVERVKQDQERKGLLLSRYYPLASYHNTVIRKFTRGMPKTTDLNSIKPGSNTGNLISNLTMMATEMGIDVREIEEVKFKLVDGLAKDRINWEKHLIDMDHVFGEAWKTEVKPWRK